MYARADLLAYQNKFDESLIVLDSIKTKFPYHTLTGKIYFLKSDIYLKRNEIALAVGFLERVYNEFSFEILADDALFKLGVIHENKIKDDQKAMAFYEKIILEYPGSIYVIEARERFRRLRGDKLN